MNEWKTIDSAPKDGTRILIYAPNYGGVRIATWSECVGIEDESVTHWMPLPHPPKQD